MSHTPGPWSADYGDCAAYCETGAEVCEVTKGNHDDGSCIPDEEMEANLRLVSAAPELLSALLFIVNDCPAPGEAAVLTPTGYNMACAAIAKAKGRE